jgi:excisionase family DNA binding protein
MEHEHAMYRTKEAAAILRCHPKTVRKMIRSGELGSVQYGGITFVPAWAIDDLLTKPAV